MIRLSRFYRAGIGSLLEPAVALSLSRLPV